MHDEALAFLERCERWSVAGGQPIGRRVLELGSRDVNGSPRSVFRDAERYVGIDVVDGPGVDVLADARTWTSDERFDTVVCTEVLEHVHSWPMIVTTAALHLERDGYLLLTAASEGREPHSVDAPGDGAVVPPRHGEHYENVDPARLLDVLRTNELEVVALEYHRHPGDVRVLARRP